MIDINELSAPTLVTERLVLKLCQPDEAHKVASYHYRNREYLKPFYPQFDDDFFSESYWVERLITNIEEFEEDQSVRFFIFEKGAESQIIGTANFSGIVRRAAQYCVLGYGLDEDKQGLGYMSEALFTAIDYMFTVKNLHRIMANYIPTNQKSANVLKRLGFVVEGYARNYLRLDGVWKDHILTARVNDCWQPDKTD